VVGAVGAGVSVLVDCGLNVNKLHSITVERLPEQPPGGTFQLGLPPDVHASVTT
jgi:hypothetical protein